MKPRRPRPPPRPEPERNIRITLTQGSKHFIAKEAYTPIYGARPVRRYLQKHIENELAAKLIKGEIKDGDEITIDIKQDELTF